MYEILPLLPFIFLLFWIFFSRRLSGERGVARKLEFLRKKNEEYHLFNNVILKTPDGTTEIDHIVISPYGIFVIETKDYKGWIFGSEDQKMWTQSLFGPNYTSTKYHFQNPIRQNYKHVKAIQDFLKIDSKFIFNVVVFSGTAEFKTDIPVNVRSMHNLIPYIKSQKEIFFNTKEAEEISRKFRDYVERSILDKDDHIRNLENNMNHPACPKCGKSMILRTAKKGEKAGSQFWGCPNFPSCQTIKSVV